MECKHPYYRITEGKLVCSQCGEPSPKASRIEDKIDQSRETKSSQPQENAMKKKAALKKK